MFDSGLNVLLIIVALVVFVGRTFLQVRGKKKPPPKQQKKPVPVFFEEEEDEPYRDLAYYVELEEMKAKEAALAEKKKTAPRKVPNERIVKDVNVNEVVIPRITPVRPVLDHSSGLTNLRNLSPLKQAVVMAEVLGTPKGLQ